MGELTDRARWYLKKSARRGVAAAGWGWHGLGHATPEPRIRALTYHRFGTATRDPFSVRCDDFELQMAWLGECGLAISLADLEAFVAGRQSLVDGSVLVTIDDAAPSVHAHALPILQRHRIPAVLFVPAGELRADGVPGDGAEGPETRMTRRQLRDIASAGVTIGSHAWTHRSLGRMPTSEARDQAMRSRADLEDLLGAPVTSFAYPFGTRADYNAGTTTVLRDAGYTTAFTSQHGAIVRGSDALTLPRVKVEGGEGQWMFQCLARGGLDGWRWIDRTLWRVQAARA